MSTTTAKDTASAFSYAQAAKGRAAANALALLSSQPTSGTSTPLKDAAAESTIDFSNITGTSEAGRSTGGESDAKATTSTNTESSTVPISVPTSPSYGSASTSTLPHEEEAAVAPKLSSDSPWDRPSAAEATGEKPDGDRRKGRKGKKEKNADKEAEKEKEEPKPVEILVAAPPPTVNIWQQRMGAQAAKIVKPAAETVLVESSPAEASMEGKATEKRKSKPAAAEDAERASANGTSRETKGQKKSAEAAKGKEDYNKRTAPRGSRVGDKEEKPAVSQVPPPVEDAVSWPTPEIALEEEKRKAQKIEGDEKNVEASKQPRQKEKWVSVPYTPSVTFNTPLPARGARGRGGRTAGRDSGRGGHGTNEGANGEKAAANAAGVSDSRERGRDSVGSGRATSLPPNASKRSAGDSSYRDARKPAAAFEKSKAESSGAKAESTAAHGRRSSITAQTEAAAVDGARSQKTEQANGVSADSHAHPQSHDIRHEHGARNGDFPKDANGHPGRERGEGRSERGRGGGYRGRGNHANFPNGQQHPQHAYTNGQGQQPVNGYGMRPANGPYSPPAQQQPFSNGFQQPPHRGRGGGPPRSQSIPNGNPMFPRFPGGPQMMPINTNGAMYDFPNAQSMSPLPYNPYVEQYSVLAMVTMQLEYYFSIDNLCKDVYLRKHMDSQGFVFLTFIAGFKRIQSLTQDFELLRYACQESEVIEIVVGDDGLDRLRRSDGWEKWVMPMEERDEAARISGPERFYRQSHRQQLPPRMHPQGHQGASPPQYSPSGAQSFPPYPNAPPAVNGGENGYAQQRHESPLSAAVPEFAPGPAAFNAADYADVETTFSDEEIRALTVVYSQKTAGGDAAQKAPYQHAFARTFSNGSIDTRLVDEELQEGEKRHSRSSTNGGGSDGSDISPERLRNPLSPGAAMSPTRLAFGNAPPVMWAKTQQQPDLSESRTNEPYERIRARALRNHAATAASAGDVVDHDMKILYHFWAHFLVRNFNPRMYEEFRAHAFADAARAAPLGVSLLAAFYDEVLNSRKRTVPDVFARHYVELVKGEDAGGGRPAFAKLRATLRNGALDMKSRKKIDNCVDAALREELER